MTTSSPLLFEGKTHLHVGENNTLDDMVHAVADILSANECYGFKIVYDMYMESDEYKVKEAKDKAFWDRFKKGERV
jgi:hypothetical protein